jgi:hypothetical protein
MPSPIYKRIKRRRRFRRHPGWRPPPLTISQILAWADSHHARTGTWPTGVMGYVHEDKNEMWRRIDAALRLGLRGLERGSSIAKLLDRERNVRNIKALPKLTEEQIEVWARKYRQTTDDWPTEESGVIPETRGETWGGVNAALWVGIRGLPGGDSLARLLKRKLGVRRKNGTRYPTVTVQNILGWADEHFKRTGGWPTNNSGTIAAAEGLDKDRMWSGVNVALGEGRVRGAAAGSSLSKLLRKHRGVCNTILLPRLTIPQILMWADAHYKRTGQWPDTRSGLIPHAKKQTWSAVHGALKTGVRGLPGGSSLTRILVEHRGVRNKVHPPHLSVQQILAWADAHFKQTGLWPRADSGPVFQLSGEKWSAVNLALRIGLRGLPGGSSLAKLLAERRGVPIGPERPRLSYRQIIAWAHAHLKQTGRRPWAHSGPVVQAPGERWGTIDIALMKGSRGLPGGTTLARLLDQHKIAKEKRGRNAL